MEVSGGTVGVDYPTVEGKELAHERRGVSEWVLGSVLRAKGWGNIVTAGLAEGNLVRKHEARSLVVLADQLSSGGEGGSVGDGTSWQCVGSLSVDLSASRRTGGRDVGHVASGHVGHDEIGIDGKQDLSASQGVHAGDGFLHKGLVGWASDTHLTELVDNDGERTIAKRGAGRLERGHVAEKGIHVVLLHEFVDLSHIGHVSGITEVLVAHLARAKGLKSRRDGGGILGPEGNSVLETHLLRSGQLRELGLAIFESDEGIYARLDVDGADGVARCAGGLGALGLLGLLGLLVVGDGGTSSQAGSEGEESQRVLHFG